MPFINPDQYSSKYRVNNIVTDKISFEDHTPGSIFINHGEKIPDINKYIIPSQDDEDIGENNVIPESSNYSVGLSQDTVYINSFPQDLLLNNIIDNMSPKTNIDCLMNSETDDIYNVYFDNNSLYNNNSVLFNNINSSNIQNIVDPNCNYPVNIHYPNSYNFQGYHDNQIVSNNMTSFTNQMIVPNMVTGYINNVEQFNNMNSINLDNQYIIYDNMNNTINSQINNNTNDNQTVDNNTNSQIDNSCNIIENNMVIYPDINTNFDNVNDNVEDNINNNEDESGSIDTITSSSDIIESDNTSYDDSDLYNKYGTTDDFDFYIELSPGNNSSKYDINSKICKLTKIKEFLAHPLTKTRSIVNITDVQYGKFVLYLNLISIAPDDKKQTCFLCNLPRKRHFCLEKEFSLEILNRKLVRFYNDLHPQVKRKRAKGNRKHYIDGYKKNPVRKSTSYRAQYQKTYKDKTKITRSRKNSRNLNVFYHTII